MRSLLLIIAGIFFLSKMAFASDTLFINNQTNTYTVSEFLYYLTDNSESLSLDSLIDPHKRLNFNKINQKVTNLGISRKVHWFQFNVKNLSSTEDWILEIDYPTLNDVSFFILDENNILDTMIISGRDKETIDNQNYSYSIQLMLNFKKNTNYKIFIRLKTNSFIILPINLMTLKEFSSKDHSTISYFYLLYGIIIALIAFNFILFFLTREMSYLLLTLYLVILLFNAYYLYGFGFDIFQGFNPIIKSRMRQVLFGLGSLVFLSFTTSYLELKKYKFFYNSIRILIAIGLIYTPLLFIRTIDQAIFSKISPFLFILGSILCFLAGIHTFRRGERMALYFIISFSVITISSIIYSLVLFDIIPFSDTAFDINILSTVAFGLLLTIGLVEKITAVRQEQAKSSQLALMNQALKDEIAERAKVEKALREREEQFKLLFELSPQPISLTELENGRIIEANHQMELLSGYKKEEVIGKTSLELGIIDKKYRDFIVGELAKSPQLLGAEIPLNSKDGNSYICLIYTQRVYIQGRDVLISVFSDITNIKNNEEALLNSERQLRELNSTKDKFFSIIAHDLMNPFNAMIGFTSMMIDAFKTGRNDEGMKYAYFIEHSSLRIFELLQNLLIWSRAQSGKIVFLPSNISVLELVKSATDVLRSVAFPKNIEIELAITENHTIFADRNMIETIIRNLVSNAIKFSEQGSKVVITLQKTESEFLFAISDAGVGIDEKHLNELFAIDKAVSFKGTGGETGIGLGLILCKEFVNAHGGKIWAESQPYKGSTFFFSIPIQA